MTWLAQVFAVLTHTEVHKILNMAPLPGLSSTAYDPVRELWQMKGWRKLLKGVASKLN